VALQRFGHTAAELIVLIGAFRYRLHYAGRFSMRLLDKLPKQGEEPNIFVFPID